MTRRSPRAPNLPAAAAPAKLSPPRLAAVVPRPRLFRILDAAARRPIVWIEGPAGSGKTTLAASWIGRRAARTLWLQVDARDQDPATFFYFLREGVRRLAPRRSEPLPLLTPEYQEGLATYSRNFFDGAFERLRAPAYVVLDDFQELPENAPLHRLLPDALGGVPEGTHILVLSRAAPPPTFARLRANGLLSTVGWDALRFTEREAAQLAAEHGLPRLAPEAFAGLYASTDGWAAGLVLVGEAARRGEPWVGARQGWTSEEVFEYFSNELLDRAEPEVQRLLLGMSVLPTITPAIAERLAGAGAGARLERLARQNFFTTRRAGAAPVYQFHPLFRAFLRARAETAVAPDERAALRRRAAALLDEAGQPEDAIALLQDAGDGPAAAALVRRLAPALEQQGRIQTLEAWIRALPDDVREGDPWMLHGLGACRLFADLRESLALQERAFAAFQARGDEAGCLAAWAGAVDAIYYAWSDFAKLDPWISWLDERVRSGPELAPPELRARATACMASRLLWRQPSHPEFSAWNDRLAAIVRDARDPDLRVRGLQVLVWYLAWIGDAARLAPALDELERACRVPGVPAATRIAASQAIANGLHYLTAEFEPALARIGEAFRLADETGIHVYDVMLHAVAAELHLSRCDAAAAAPHLAAMRATPASTPYYWLAAWRAHLLGDLDGAVALAQRGLETVQAAGVTMTVVMLEFQLAQHERARGDLGTAAHHLAAAEEAAAAGRSAIHAWACKLARAQLSLDAGDRAACRSLLADALGEGRERGYRNVPWWSTALALEGLCEEALDAGIEPDYVRDLIRLHGLAPDPARPGAERWPLPVRMRALGPFVLEREGARARTAGRSKPLELLRALVALGGREVPERRVAELLWPDADGGSARQRLKHTLHMLRRLLGPEDVLTLEKGLLSLDPRRVSIDTWELERHLAAAGAALERRRPDELGTPLRRALALCRGRLLQGDTEPWVVAARERLEGRFLRLLVQGADVLVAVDPAAALPDLERALELFPHEERLRQALARARSG